MKSIPLPAIPLRPLLTWIISLSLLLGLGAAVLFLAHWKVDDQAAGYYVPRGYRASVAGMLDTNALRHTAPDGGDRNARRWGTIDFDESTASPKEQQFFKQSRRLQKDIGRFNEDGGGFFEVRLNGAIGVARDFHNFSLPYPRREAFRGSLSLADEALPAIISPDLYLGFSEKDEEGAPFRASDYGNLAFADWTKPVGEKSPAGKSGTLRFPAYVLNDPNGRPFVRFFMRKGGVMMETVISDTVLVYLNGDVINAKGNSAAAAAFLARGEQSSPEERNTAPLRIGDRLRFRRVRDGSQVIFRFGQFAGSIVSRRWMEDGRSVSVVDPELAADLPYLSSLHDALNRFVRNYPEASSLKQPDIRLTFDKSLHKTVSGIFLDGVRQFDARRSAVPRIDREPACVTILNALNGDVLAIPSYPAPEDIERLRRQSLTDRANAIPDLRLKRLGINQNLTLIPIGSTTKPLLASVFWDKYPELSKLVIQESNGGRRDVLGFQLAHPYSTTAGAPWVKSRRVDYRGFLCMSSNDYTIHQGLLALAGGASFNSAGQPVPGNGGALDLSRYITGKDSIPQGLLSLPVFPNLAKAYDISLQSKVDEDSGTDWDLGALTDLLRQTGVDEAVLSPNLPADPAERARVTGLRHALFNSFSRTLPEATNLHLDKVGTVRGDYTAMLLGSGFNYWSNMKLAEAYARLGTARKVRARVALDPKKTVTLEDFEELPLSADALRKVHEGMKDAADGAEGSTAGRIVPSVRAARERYAKKGLIFKALCKTGTASRVPARKDKSGRIIEQKRECSAFCLYMEVSDKSGKRLAALSVATYLQDRAATLGNHHPRNSAVAVQLTAEFFAELLGWIDRQPGVGKKE